MNGILTKKAVLLVACAIAAAGFAATNYVDCVNGVDATGRGGALTNAWKTLQYAVDKSSANDVILVAPGEYNEGYYETSDATNRMYIKKKLTSKSLQGREKTHIVGYDVLDQNNLPQGNVRCIEITSNGNGTIIDGFTLRGAYGSQEGVAARCKEAMGSYLIDCVISNNIGTAKGLVIRMAIVRSLVVDNIRTDGGYFSSGSGCLNCVFARNSVAPVVAYPGGPVVNCTFAGNAGNSVRYGSAPLCCNSVIVYEQPGVPNGSSGCATFKNSVWTFTSACSSNASENCYGSQPVQQIMSPMECDFRIVEGSTAQTAGDAAHLTLVTLPEGYESERYRDVFGNPIPTSGTIMAGAVQVAARAVCGITFPSEEDVTINGNRVKPQKCGAHACYDHWPVQVRGGVGGSKQPTFFGWRGRLPSPDLDNTYLFTLASNDMKQAVSMVFANKVLYVNKATGDNSYDGLSETVGEPDAETGIITVGPKRTIQAAVDEVEAANKMSEAKTVIIKVAEGVYDEGERYFHGSNRVYVAAGKYARIVATGARERTIIMGAADDSGTKGLGTAAVRCVSSGGNSALQGFTLTGGHTLSAAADGDDYTIAGAGFFSPNGQYPYVSDCIISNNVGKKGSVISGGWFSRCFIVENDHSQDQYDLVRKAVLCSCVLDRNKMGSNPAEIGDGTSAYQCTVRASSGKSLFRLSSGNPLSDTICNSLFFDSTCSSRPTRMAGSLYDNVKVTDAHSGYTTGDAAFVDKAANDLRITSLSDAIGAGIDCFSDEYANTTYTNYCNWVSSDIEGNPLTFTDGKPTAGAYQRALLAVTVQGRKVTPAAGNYVLEPNGSLTVTATSARGFRGFKVNGEMAEGRELSYTIAAGSGTNAKGGISIEPVYQFGTYFTLR